MSVKDLMEMKNKERATQMKLAKEAARQIIISPEMFWRQIDLHLPDKFLMSKIRLLIELKAAIEATIVELTIKTAQNPKSAEK